MRTISLPAVQPAGENTWYVNGDSVPVLFARLRLLSGAEWAPVSGFTFTKLLAKPSANYTEAVLFEILPIATVWYSVIVFQPTISLHDRLNRFWVAWNEYDKCLVRAHWDHRAHETDEGVQYFDFSLKDWKNFEKHGDLWLKGNHYYRYTVDRWIAASEAVEEIKRGEEKIKRMKETW